MTEPTLPPGWVRFVKINGGRIAVQVAHITDVTEIGAGCIVKVIGDNDPLRLNMPWETVLTLIAASRQPETGLSTVSQEYVDRLSATLRNAFEPAGDDKSK